MLTPIEVFLFESPHAHAVLDVFLSVDQLKVTLAPWTDLSARRCGEFSQAKIRSIETFPVDPDDLNLPWDLLGFDCDSLPEARWKFVLHCQSIELIFESLWPVLPIE